MRMKRQRGEQPKEQLGIAGLYDYDPEIAKKRRADASFQRKQKVVKTRRVQALLERAIDLSI